MAYESLVRRYQEAAVRTAWLIAPDGEADDAVQLAFIKAFRALPTFHLGAPFRPWLLRIVANEARNRRRSAGRRAGLVLRAAEDRRPGDAAPSPESAVLDREQREALLAAVNGLGDADREIIGIRYFLDLNEAETADVLGIPRGTVKSRLSRALARLRVQMLADVEGGPEATAQAVPEATVQSATHSAPQTVAQAATQAAAQTTIDGRATDG